MCDICGKYFRQRSTMERHKLTHQTHRDHECKICNKKFKYKHYLTTHMKIHEGNKPYVCTFCGLRFAQNGNMLKHIKQLHTPQEKSHVCKICNKGMCLTFLNFVIWSIFQRFQLLYNHTIWGVISRVTKVLRRRDRRQQLLISSLSPCIQGLMNSVIWERWHVPCAMLLAKLKKI